MANHRSSGKVFIDSTGSVTDQTILVSSILFTPNAANDELLLRETSAGDDCIYLRSATAKTTMQFDFSLKPIVFQNGLYVQTITSGAKAVLITTSAGK